MERPFFFKFGNRCNNIITTRIIEERYCKKKKELEHKQTGQTINTTKFNQVTNF
jgi:hypothetical protein